MACKLGFCYEGIPGPGPLLPRSAVPIAQGMPCGISRGPGHCAKSAHEAVLQFSRDMTALSSWHRRASIPAKTQNQPLHQQLTKLGLKSQFRQLADTWRTPPGSGLGNPSAISFPSRSIRLFRLDCPVSLAYYLIFMKYEI